MRFNDLEFVIKLNQIPYTMYFDLRVVCFKNENRAMMVNKLLSQLNTSYCYNIPSDDEHMHDMSPLQKYFFNFLFYPFPLVGYFPQ